jgi:thioredoxin-related protein
MKKILLLAFAAITISPSVMAKKDPPAAKTAAPAEEIHWLTSVEELQMKMQQQPKKVIVDMYTGWCGWCKKMDAETYTNPSVVKYINNNYYALKLDAERKDTINFQGKQFFFVPEYKTNGFALEILKDYLAKGGNLMYPQTVIMMENFQNPNPIPGYLTVPQLEPVLTYFGDNAYRRQSWDQYSKTYQPRWGGASAPASAPPGH